MRKRALSIILAVILCLPFASFAVNANTGIIVTNFDEFIEVFNSANTIIIGGRIDVPSGTNLNFSGKQIMRHSDYTGPMFVLLPGDELTTILFLSFNGGGTFGGRLITSYGNANISGLRVQFHNSIYSGSVVYIADGHANIEHSYLFHNITTDGAIITAESNATVTIHSSSFSTNIGTVGGAIRNNGGNITINHTSFSQNKAQVKGAAIVNLGGIVRADDNVRFSQDVARVEASTIFNTGTLFLDFSKDETMPIYGFFYDEAGNRFSGENIRQITEIPVNQETSIVFVNHIEIYLSVLSRIPDPILPPTPTPTPEPTPEPTPTPEPEPPCDYDDCECGEFCELGNCECGYIPTPTPSPTPSPSPEHTPTAKPTPQPTETPPPTPEVTATPEPPAPTSSPEPEETPAPSPEPTPIPTPETTPTLLPIITPPPQPTPQIYEHNYGQWEQTHTPEQNISTPTPTPQATAMPTITPQQTITEENIIPTATTESPMLPKLQTRNGVELDRNGRAHLIGYPDGTLRLYQSLTRAEFAVIVYRLLTPNSIAKFYATTNNFTDVGAGEWHSTAISTLKNSGIIVGVGDNRFDPNGYLTWAHIIAIMFNFVEAAPEFAVSNPSLSSHWAWEGIRTAIFYGWIVNDGLLDPDAYIMRGQMVEFLNKVLE